MSFKWSPEGSGQSAADGQLCSTRAFRNPGSLPQFPWYSRVLSSCAWLKLGHFHVYIPAYRSQEMRVSAQTSKEHLPQLFILFFWKYFCFLALVPQHSSFPSTSLLTLSFFAGSSSSGRPWSIGLLQSDVPCHLLVFLLAKKFIQVWYYRQSQKDFLANPIFACFSG